MVIRTDQQQIKALLTEAITVLCKNGLNYNSEFAIEGLLAITLDKEDIFLVKVNEVICNGNVKASETKTSTECTHNDSGDSKGAELSAPVSLQPRNLQRRRTSSGCNRGGSASKRQALERPRTVSSGSLDESKDPVIIKEEIPSDTEEEVQGYLSQGSTSNVYQGSQVSENSAFEETQSDMSGQEVNYMPEDIMWERGGYDFPSGSQDMLTGELTQPHQPMMVAPLECAAEWQWTRRQPLTTRSCLVPHLEVAILKQEGCVVMPRLICRQKRVSAQLVIEVMKSLTRPRDDPNYIGEYVDISVRTKVFYKCPPGTLGRDALKTFGLNEEVYTELFYRNTRHSTGAPHSWHDYVWVLIDKCPYHHELFPVESMGLSEEQVWKVRFRVARMVQRSVPEPSIHSQTSSSAQQAGSEQET